jgi:flagellar assembly protein FliH
MSSSARVAPLAASAASPHAGELPQVLPFAYGEAVTQRANQAVQNQNEDDSSPAKKTETNAQTLTALTAELEAQLREAGRQQGLLEGRAKLEEQVAKERAAVAQALTDFARERAAYYSKIEEEAVRLALSIARRVLYREAQVDPLLLAGVVRVALEKMEGATEVALLVAPQRAAEWHRYLSVFMDAGRLPEIIEDPAMTAERCGLRTSTGTADFDVSTQLKEIEQGLMDLLAARPKGKS